jgi:hypothetical protein
MCVRDVTVTHVFLKKFTFPFIFIFIKDKIKPQFEAAQTD